MRGEPNGSHDSDGSVCGNGASARPRCRRAIAWHFRRTLVTRSIQSLEDDLGVRLMNRTTRSISLTEAGQQYFSFCDDLLASVSEMNARITNQANEARGEISVLAPKWDADGNGQNVDRIHACPSGYPPSTDPGRPRPDGLWFYRTGVRGGRAHQTHPGTAAYAPAGCAIYPMFWWPRRPISQCPHTHPSIRSGRASYAGPVCLSHLAIQAGR